MADGRRNVSVHQLDMEQMLLEAQHRWLRPAEICEILRNYKNFCIAPEPPNKPQSGSLFLFDRKILRYFRKDGHNWRKKKDGKTVKEAHERLKADSVDVLHCYYAHGEENENFQRRSYWLLEEDFMHIVLVHYLEIKGNRTSLSRPRGFEETAQAAHKAIPTTSFSFSNQNQSLLRTMDTESHSSTHTSGYEDNESDNHQASSRYHPVPGMLRYEDGPVMDVHLFNLSASSPITSQFEHKNSAACSSEFRSASQDEMPEVLNEDGLGYTSWASQMKLGFTSWEGATEHSMTGFQDASVHSSLAMEATLMGDFPKQQTATFTELSMRDSSLSQVTILETHQIPVFHDELDNDGVLSIDNVNSISNEDRNVYPSLLKQLSMDLDGEGLKKYDSFSKWMSKELGEVDDSHLNPTSEPYWSSVESGHVLEDPCSSNQEQLGAYLIGPSLSQDQLFSILEICPNWAYNGLETKVLINGVFLMSNDEVKSCKWSCMFGEVEVPADVIADGTLCCYAPLHRNGRVPFYVTSSNRLACSEVREFEFREQQKMICESYERSMNDVDLFRRFAKLLSREEVGSTAASHDCVDKLNQDCLLDGKHNLNQKSLKEKFDVWLLSKVAEDGRSLRAFDEGGQCVLHLASALGYDWAIEPILDSGVNVNFRDLHGWTALHWAARYGREWTVVFLISLGAAPGALTDPTPKFPSGRTPADVASANYHKGIAGYLAEASLTTHLSTLALRDSGINALETSDLGAVEDATDQNAVQISVGETEAALSLKDSLSAVRKATLAAARIHQAFRVDSFNRKKKIEIGDNNCGMSEEMALSLITVKHTKPGNYDSPAHVAAVSIQNKFRSWKGRREFLITRQRIIKIQAHVRGYQVRKHYKKIVWSVGIVEKVILRWRRRGAGLRGFRSEGLLESSPAQIRPSKDDYDFLREGRKQTEARLDKALARVKSMIQYPEARDQYRRLQIFGTELKDSKVMLRDRNVPEVEDGDSMMVEQEGMPCEASLS